MFNDTSIIKEVNILNKVICYLFVLIMVLVCNDILFITFVDIFFLLVTKSYKQLFRFNLVITLLILIAYRFTHLLWIIKLLMLVLYTVLLKKVTKLMELRYAIESTLYRFHQKKITYRLFYIIYFLRNFKMHFKKMLILKDDYEMKLTPEFLFFITKQSLIKAKLGKNDFLEINNQRFYNYSKSRTYIEKVTWESWDTTYLMCHLFVLFLTFFYGR